MALADAQIDKVSGIVNGKLGAVMGWARSAETVATNAIDAIGKLTIPNIEIQFPEAPNLTAPEAPDSGAPPDHAVDVSPQSTTFAPTGTISLKTSAAIPDPLYGSAVDVPERPSVDIPAPPTSYPTVGVSAVPSAPSLSTPASPEIVAPDFPEFLDVVAVEIPPLALADFATPIPGHAATVAALKRIDAEIDKIYAQVEGRFRNEQARANNLYKELVLGINRDSYLLLYTRRLDAQRKRLMDEAASVVDREVVVKTEEATTLWASRNFSLAPGMLVDQVNELEIEGGRKVRDASSKINQEIAKIAAEDFKKELDFYMTLEQVFIDLHLEQIREASERQKIQVRQQIELFNASLELFNAKIAALNVDIEAYNTQLKSLLEYNAAYGKVVEGAIAETAVNEALLQVFNSQVQIQKAQTDVYSSGVKAAAAPLEAYKATLLGVKANADTIVANIGAYREAIKGYAAAVEATSSEVEAYASQIQAAASAGGVAETNARAYATNIQEAVRRNSVYKTFADEQADLLNANVQTFRDVVGANESFLRTQAAKVGAEAEIMSARAAAYDKQVRTFASYNKALADYTAATMSHSMTSAENVARAQALANQAAAEAAKIDAGAMAAKASALAGLAQGAMSALHVSASAQGTGGTTSSYSYSTNWTSNWGGTTRKSESKIQRLTA